MGGVGAGGCGLGFSMGESSREAGFRVRVFEAGSSAVVAMETEAARNPCGKENDGWRRAGGSVPPDFFLFQSKLLSVPTNIVKIIHVFVHIF
jgi:hypothetical protein